MKQLLSILSVLFSLASFGQNIHPLGGTPAGNRLMTSGATGGLSGQNEIVHAPVQAATIVPLPTCTYNNLTNGFLATLIANSSGALGSIDGVPVSVGQRILVNNQADSTQNGIYVIDSTGGVSNKWGLHRGEFSSIPANIKAGSMVCVVLGTINAGHIMVQMDTVSTIVIGTTKLYFNPSNLNPSLNLADLSNPTVAAANLGLSPSVPGVPQGINPNFIVNAVGIPRPNNVAIVGDSITYDLVTGGSHLNIFFDSAYGTNDNRINIGYPNTRTIIYGQITPDESYANFLAITGCSVGTNSMSCPVYEPALASIKFTGNSSGTTSGAWTITGLCASYFKQPYYPGGYDIEFADSAIGVANGDQPNAVSAMYVGSHNYHVQLRYSGFSGPGTVTNLIWLMDSANNHITTAPTSADIVIVTGGIWPYQLNMWKYTAFTVVMGGTSSFFNFWARGQFEAYMLAQQVSTTAIYIKYQTNYPSATAYKLYRCSSKFQAQTFPATGTLVYTGGAGTAGTYGIFTDTGLTTQTNYWYQLVATIGGVDTYITYFQCATA